MRHYRYLIVGGGMTADAAVQGIREVDRAGSIGVVSAESDPPYDRPPLTKGLWKETKLETIWRSAVKQDAEFIGGRRVEKLDLWGRKVTDDEGTSYGFEKLLLATGGRPRTLPVGGDSVIYYRTLSDYRKLRELTRTGSRFAVIGGGFIGPELAASLAMNGLQVSLLFRGGAIGDHMLPQDLAEFLNEYYRQKGIQVLPGESVAGLERRGAEILVKTQSGKELAVNGVIAGLGIEPNVELAERAGLRVESGIVVDGFLQTSHPDIYAAGDVAAFYNPALRRRVRVEHEDNANAMGKLAGKNMAGIPNAYTYLPYFYSDLFDLGYEAIGETNSHLAITADWKERFREGVIYYQREGVVRGVVLWNVWGKVSQARELIQQRKPHQPEELLGQHLLQAA